MRILQSPAQGRLDAEQLGSFQEWIGSGLACRVIAVTDNRLEATGQVMSREMMVHPVVRRGRGDSPREPQAVQCVQQLNHPRLQELTIRRQHFEMAYPGAYEFVNRESRPEMVEKDGSDLLPGTTNRLAKNARGHVVPSLGRRHQDCRLIERLGVKRRPSMSKMTAAGMREGFTSTPW